MHKVKVISYSKFIEKAFNENGAIKKNAVDGLRLPLGISKDSIEYLDFTGNVILCGGVKSGKTNILHNLLVSCCTLYTAESLDIIVFDQNVMPIGRYIKDGTCLHPQMMLVEPDDTEQTLTDLVKELKERRSNGYNKVKLLVIDNVNTLLENPETSSALCNILGLGHTAGIYCLLIGDDASLGYLKVFCSDFIIAPMCKEEYSEMKLDVPYVKLPSKFGIATYATKFQDEISLSVLYIPKGDWKEQRDIMLAE